MFCSTIIPTIGRASLARAVESVLSQELEGGEFEVIVVNDTGRPLPDAPWQQSAQVRVIITQRRERCVARNSGAAVARGQYLHFLDDDDWLLPGALAAFWELAQRAPDAHWIYGSAQLVDREGQPLIQLHHGLQGNGFLEAMAGEWIPLQTSLVAADAFFTVGGFHPRVLATQDVDLTRRITLHGDLAETTQVVGCIGMGEAGSSTDRVRGPAYSRWARELILNEPGAWRRMRAGVVDGTWNGRMARIYLTSVIWNLQHRKVFTAMSRGVAALVSVFGAWRYWWQRDFWHALTHAYDSPTFQRGWQAVKQKQEAL